MRASTQSATGVSQSGHTGLWSPDKTREQKGREAGVKPRIEIHTGSQPRIIRVYHVTCVASPSFSLFVFSQGAYRKSVLRSLEDGRAHSPEIARQKNYDFSGHRCPDKGREGESLIYFDFHL